VGGATGSSNFITERGFTGVRCRAHEGGGVPGAAGTLEWGEEIAHGREGSEGGTGGFLRWNLEEKRKGGEWRGGSVPSNGPHAAGRAARPHHVASGGDTERDRGRGGRQVGQPMSGPRLRVKERERGEGGWARDQNQIKIELFQTHSNLTGSK
jgi:hypothetical protein